MDVHVVADTADTVHIVFPPAPNADLADDDLDSIAGGFHWTGHESGRAAFHAHFSNLLDRIRANAWRAIERLAEAKALRDDPEFRGAGEGGPEGGGGQRP